MKSSRLISSLIVAAALPVLFFTAARASAPETSSIKFSDPARPGTLKVTIANGDISIHGADTSEVTIGTELKPEGSPQRGDGLRVLSSSSSYSLTEKDNVIKLSYGAGSWPGTGGNFEITVPRSTNIVISSAFGGDISIGKVDGDVEVKSLNGEVKLTDISSGALVETMNGEIRAEILAVKENKPLSFTSMNGEVALKVPVTAKVNLRLRTHNGSILTDFDESQLITKTATLKSKSDVKNDFASDDIRATVREAVRMGMDAAREAARGAREGMEEANHASHGMDETEPVVTPPPMPPLPPMTGGKIVTGTLNGGGPELRVTTMNGDVTLRKAAAAK